MGVPTIRIIAYWGLYWGRPILGNYHLESNLNSLKGVIQGSSIGVIMRDARSIDLSLSGVWGFSFTICGFRLEGFVGFWLTDGDSEVHSCHAGPSEFTECPVF